MPNKTYLSWSGGKDSALALYYCRQTNVQVDCLVTSLSSEQDRVSMHGVKKELLEAQARSLGMPLRKMFLPQMPSMDEYESIILKENKAMADAGFNRAIFGDLFLEDLRNYREKLFEGSGILPSFPLWKRNTKDLMKEFIDLGFKAVLVCINGLLLDESFAGREIDRELINDLPQNVDPCGENGEFHSFVYDGPIFKFPVPFNKGNTVKKIYPSPTLNTDKDKEEPARREIAFWYCDLQPLVS